MLGRIVEIVSVQTFDNYLEQDIFTPLAMTDTGFYVKTHQQARLAKACVAATSREPLRLLPPMDIPITEKPPLMEGAAGLVSTVPDYLRFLQALRNKG